MAESDQTGKTTGANGGEAPPEAGTGQTEADRGNESRDKSIDELLAEFGGDDGDSTATAGRETAEPSGSEGGDRTLEEIRQTRQELQEFRRERAGEKARADLDAAVETFKSEFDDGQMSERMAKRFLEGAAADDPRIARAWSQRHDKPREWEQVVRAVAKEYRKELGPPVDRNATEDREAAVASARSQTTKAADKPLSATDVFDMPPDQWAEEQRKLGVKPV